MLSDFRVTSLPKWQTFCCKLTAISTAVNNKCTCKSTFSLLYLRNCRVRSLTLQQTEQNNSEKQNSMLKYVGNNWSALQIQMRKTQSSLVDWLIDCCLGTRLCDRRLVLWLVNSGIWQSVDVWETLKFRGYFSNVWGVNGFLVSLPIRRSTCIWPIAGEFWDRSKSVAWFYGWKCVVCFSHELRWLSTFYLFYFPPPSTSYNSLNNARNSSGFHMEQQEK